MKDFSTYEMPISANEPTGSDIEYDSRFLELQRLAEGTPEQQYGDVIIESKEPEWGTLEKLCNQLLAESKDVRLFAYNILILTARYGVIGFEAGCHALAINLSNYWQDIYPHLVDEDGDEDFYYRINALSLLVSSQGVVKYLGNAKLLTNGINHQPISLKDACLLLQDDNKENYVGGRDRLLLDIQVGFDGDKPELLALKNAMSHLEQIEDIYNKQLPAEHLPNFDEIKKYIKAILLVANHQDSVIHLHENQPNEEVGAAMMDVVVPLNTVPSADTWRKANITNRKDVELVLEKVCLYFEEFEPSHPGPLFIRRIQRLMNMNFYDIMKDISPTSLDNLEVLIGRTVDNDPDF